MCELTPSIEPDPVHVVAGIILDASSRVLIARRPQHLHQGGLWEFPGGKRHDSESPELALKRELAEELALEVIESRHFLTVRHRYSDKAVLLDFYLVAKFDGEPKGNEGQPVRWVELTELSAYPFPEANWPVIERLQNIVRDDAIVKLR